MSDASVSEALRSVDPLVVIEAPAGCGKTHQAGQYARWLASTTTDAGKVLILTHTHAACDVFRSRTSDISRRVAVSTIDSMVTQIGGMYHQTLGLPQNVSAWARTTRDGYAQLAVKVSTLLSTSKHIAKAVACRHPTIVCDEHQDTNAAQNKLVLALHDAGAKLRIFGDTMQSIFGADDAQERQWADLAARANRYEELDFPHRWAGASEELGQWVLRARAILKAGQAVDLRRDLPAGLQIIRADNEAPRHGGFQLANGSRRPLDAMVNGSPSMLILCPHTATIRGLQAFWGRSIPVWEGHTREALSLLIAGCQRHNDNAREIAIALRDFMGAVGVGFSPSGFTDRLLTEIDAGCVGNGTGKPGHLRNIGRHLLLSPNHVGVARALTLIKDLAQNEQSFQTIKIDMRKEFHDAIRLGEYEDADHGLTEITRKRIGVQSTMPNKTLSTVHKAKGLENTHAVVLPCDAVHFADNSKNRCLLYVALSRATTSLTLVVSPNRPTPLLII
ncbi:UvrD-helicase domain-containing protein [Undibacterium sp. Rencai35W]|uniref:UvrD-helicase domain-containing protein n=1 Tax=Undibacterium sp. Rencai35W TaxID=3413046 RepID=UPI003BF03906